MTTRSDTASYANYRSTKSIVHRLNLHSQTYSGTQQFSTIRFLQIQCGNKLCQFPLHNIFLEKVEQMRPSFENILVCQNCCLRIRKFHKFISPYYLQPVISHSKSLLQTKSWQIISSQTQKFLWTQVWKIMLSNHTLTFLFVLFVNIYHVNLLILHFPSFHWKNWNICWDKYLCFFCNFSNQYVHNRTPQVWGSPVCTCLTLRIDFARLGVTLEWSAISAPSDFICPWNSNTQNCEILLVYFCLDFERQGNKCLIW